MPIEGGDVQLAHSADVALGWLLGQCLPLSYTPPAMGLKRRAARSELKPHHLEWLKIDWCDFLDITPLVRTDMRRSLKKRDPRGERSYVYVLWRDDLGEPVPFYVGKGIGNRLFQHTAPSEKQNKYKKALLAKLIRDGAPERYSIVEFFTKETKALELEIELIRRVGRADINDGPLTNRTDGGDGSKGHLAKSGDQSPSARRVVVDGVAYGSLTTATKGLNKATPGHEVTNEAVAARIRNGWPGYFYEDEGQQPLRSGVVGRYRRPVHVPKGDFGSMSKAATRTGESVKSIYKHIDLGWEGYYYLDEGQRPRRSNDKPCEIDGEFYSSQTEAARAESRRTNEIVTKAMVAKRLRSSNRPGWRDLSGTIETEQKLPQKKRRVWVDGVEYESAAAAERAGHGGHATILARCSSSNEPGFVGEGIEKEERSPELAKMAVAVTVEGATYATLTEAARAFSVSISAVKSRCRSPERPEWTSEDPALATRKPKDGKRSLIGIMIHKMNYRSINAASKKLGERRDSIKRKLDDNENTDYLYR